MAKNIRKIGFYFKLILLLVFLNSASEAWSLPASPIGVVEVSGKELSELVGKEIAKMEVRVFKGGQWKGIPYQIDEKSADPYSGARRWVLDEAFSRRTDLPQANGKLDEDEVILFMQKDMGEKGVPSPGSAVHVAEIRAGGSYAYLFFEPKAPMKSNGAYVRYDPKEDRVDAEAYENRFNLKHPIVQEELMPKNPKAGPPANILDRFKVRMMLAIKNFLDFQVEEENITARKVGYRAGPIRIIRRISAYKSLGPIRVTPKVESDFFFYPYFVQIPTRLDNPLDGRKYLDKKSKGFAGFDFTRFFYGSKFYSDKNPEPVIIDGTMSAAEQNLKTQGVSWWVATGEKGTVLVKIYWDPALLKAGVNCNLYYMDDRNSLKPPEMDPGEAVVGFQLDFTEIPAGHYLLYVNQIFPPGPFEMGSEAALLGQLKSPAVTVTFLS